MNTGDKYILDNFLIREIFSVHFDMMFANWDYVPETTKMKIHLVEEQIAK